MRTKVAIGLIAAAGALVGGCGNDKSREDAADTHDIDKAPPHVLGFSNHYPNVEAKCDGPNRVYVITHDSAKANNLVVVQDSANCGGHR